MIILAIDTALEDCSVAIARGTDILAMERTIGRGHAELLMPMIASLLSEAGVPPAEIDRVAVSVGPGSFTGLRVGIAAARGLAVAGAAKAVGVPTLQAHARLAAELRGVVSGRPILVLLPARADELYGQVFSPAGEPLEPMSLRSAAEFALLAETRHLDLAGAGAAAIGGSREPLHRRSAPSILSVLELGARLSPDQHPPRPVYGKPPDATPQRQAGIARR